MPSPLCSTVDEELTDKLTPSDAGTSDVLTKNYINSLRMRSDVKTALKTHLDSLNCEHASSQHVLHAVEKDRSSEANLSMATSEISNCDSKDVAELDSMLSTSPFHNGLNHDTTDVDTDDVIPNGDVTGDDVTHHDVTRNNADDDTAHKDDVTHNDDVTHTDDVTVVQEVGRDEASTSKVVWTNEVGDSSLNRSAEMNSVEKSKRVLFNDDKDVFEIDKGKV